MRSDDAWLETLERQAATLDSAHDALQACRESGSTEVEALSTFEEALSTFVEINSRVPLHLLFRFAATRVADRQV